MDVMVASVRAGRECMHIAMNVHERTWLRAHGKSTLGRVHALVPDASAKYIRPPLRFGRMIPCHDCRGSSLICSAGPSTRAGAATGKREQH